MMKSRSSFRLSKRGSPSVKFSSLRDDGFDDDRYEEKQMDGPLSPTNVRDFPAATPAAAASSPGSKSPKAKFAPSKITRSSSTASAPPAPGKAAKSPGRSVVGGGGAFRRMSRGRRSNGLGRSRSRSVGSRSTGRSRSRSASRSHSSRGTSQARDTAHSRSRSRSQSRTRRNGDNSNSNSNNNNNSSNSTNTANTVAPKSSMSSNPKYNKTAAKAAAPAAASRSTNSRKNKQQKQNQPSPRRLFSNLGLRFSKNRGQDKAKLDSSTSSTEDVVAHEEPDSAVAAVEEDPVMKIFESRNTQRVRFSFDVEASAPSKPRGKAAKSGSSSERSSGNNVKQFMSRALFGGNKSSRRLNEEMKREVAAAGGDSIVWASADTPSGPEVVHTQRTSPSKSNNGFVVSFTEDPKARATVTKLLSKARRAEHIHFRYEYAVKCYVKALDILKKAKYPQDHPTVAMTVSLLNTAHHVLSSYNNSASIVKMGIKYEDAGELVRALKMYTIAYRIRRDNLNRNHPSLVVLLNMLGSVQIKRNELKEAMQIYELALKDAPVIFSKEEEDHQEIKPPTANLLAKSVTYREMGVIYERIGNNDDALKSYHKSLECVAEWKEAVCGDEFPSFHGRHGSGRSFSGHSHSDASAMDGTTIRAPSAHHASHSYNTNPDSSSILNSSGILNNDILSTNDSSDKENGGMESPINGVQLAPCSSSKNEDGNEAEVGEMELYLSPEAVSASAKSNMYESFFPLRLEGEIEKTTPSATANDSFADMDLALTIHRIAQLHRCQGKFSEALDAYEIALRGMKYASGKYHPNVAAVLGNIGNLQKEMGNMDAAYKTYQEVLGIESYCLGLSHPDVAITLHNIATIDAAKGNYDHALTLYRKVLGLQKKLFGEDHISVSITAACMGDVYERLGELKNAIEIYEEAVRIKSAAVGRHSLEVARILHKLGKLSIVRKEFHMAESFISRSVLIYRLNKLGDDHEWIVDAYRDAADIDAALAMGEGRHFEC